MANQIADVIYEKTGLYPNCHVVSVCEVNGIPKFFEIDFLRAEDIEKLKQHIENTLPDGKDKKELIELAKELRWDKKGQQFKIETSIPDLLR